MSDNFIFCKLLKKNFFVNFYWIFYIVISLGIMKKKIIIYLIRILMDIL